MRLVVELSGEHGTLPVAELEGALAALGDPGARVEHEPGVALADTDVAPRALAERVALAHVVDAHWASVAPSEPAILAALGERDL
ncbi:MAG: hypothetical protein ACYDCK_12975, partial [Thermoplasmatota archaeon]